MVDHFDILLVFRSMANVQIFEFIKSLPEFSTSPNNWKHSYNFWKYAKYGLLYFHNLAGSDEKEFIKIHLIKYWCTDHEIRIIFFLLMIARMKKILELMKDSKEPKVFWFSYIPVIALGTSEHIMRVRNSTRFIKVVSSSNNCILLSTLRYLHSIHTYKYVLYRQPIEIKIEICSAFLKTYLMMAFC